VKCRTYPHKEKVILKPINVSDDVIMVCDIVDPGSDPCFEKEYYIIRMCSKGDMLYLAFVKTGTPKEEMPDDVWFFKKVDIKEKGERKAIC
jgi:hypothetical protein